MMYLQRLNLCINLYKMDAFKDAIVKSTCNEFSIRNGFNIFENAFVKVTVLKRLLLTSNSSYIEFLKFEDVWRRF